MNHRIGILGGYGRTGTFVAAELMKVPNVEVVLGGRNISKVDAVLRSIDNTSARAVAADVFDPESLKRFCRDTDVVVNCTSPTCLVLDRVAKAAVEAGAHYIDPGGYETVHRSMKSRNAEVAAKGCSCLISAGLCPGITELLVRHIAEQFDAPDSVDFYMDGRAEMSSSVFEDMIHTFFPLGVGSFERGTETPRNKWSSKWFEFPKPIGKQRAVPMLWPEIQHFAADRRLPHLGWHVAANLQFLALKEMIHPLLKNHTKFGAWLLKTFYDLELSKYGDMYVFMVESEGQKNGAPHHVIAKLVAQGNEHYRLTAVGIVIAAGMIMNGEAAAGVHYLADAVKPSSFMEKLWPFGVQLHVGEKKL